MPTLYTPSVIERTSRGERTYDIFSRLLMDRIIFLGTPINDDVSNIIIAQLLFLEADNPEREVSIYINSPGGSVSAGLAMYDTMQLVQPDVGTTCLGFAASMGAVLLCGGAKGKRFALPHARIMMHQPSGGIGGTTADIAIQADNMRYVKRTVQERIAFHSGQTVEQIEQDSDRDRWFTAEQAKAYGLIDEVISEALVPA